MSSCSLPTPREEDLLVGLSQRSRSLDVRYDRTYPDSDGDASKRNRSRSARVLHQLVDEGWCSVKGLSSSHPARSEPFRLILPVPSWKNENTETRLLGRRRKGELGTGAADLFLPSLASISLRATERRENVERLTRRIPCLECKAGVPEEQRRFLHSCEKKKKKDETSVSPRRLFPLPSSPSLPSLLRLHSLTLPHTHTPSRVHSSAHQLHS